MKKLLNIKTLLLIPLILSIGIIPFVPNSHAQTFDLEECRDGLIIVHLINGNTFTCKTPETAERWVELGLAIIVDPNYNPEPEIKLEPKSIIEIIEESTTPEITPIPEPFTSDVSVDNKSETATNVLEDIVEEKGNPKENPGKPPDHSKANPLPGTPTGKLGGDGVGAFGSVVIEVFTKDGVKKYHREDHNLVVDIGLESLSDLAFGTTHVSGESAGGFTWISVGTGGTAPVAGNTDCEAQHGSKKQDATVTNTALGAIINVSWIAELAADTIQEICLTDNGSPATGNLFSRQTYASIPIAATDTINAEWTITFADSNGT